MATSEMQERWGRETRMLVLVVVVSLAVLLVLARFRFPAQNLTVAPPVQGPLAGLAGRSAFDDLGATLNTLLTRVKPRLTDVRVKGPEPEPRTSGRAARAEPPPAISQVVPALRVRSDLGLLFMPAGATMAEGDGGTPFEVAALDAEREIGLVRLPPADIAADPAFTFAGFTYVGAITATPSGLTIAPAFIGRADRAVDPLWRGLVYMIDAGPDLRPGSFAFTMEGQFVGFVARGSAGTVIVPAPTLAGVADGLLRSGTNPS
jgi:hypothetical protein